MTGAARGKPPKSVGASRSFRRSGKASGADRVERVLEGARFPAWRGAEPGTGHGRTPSRRPGTRRCPSRGEDLWDPVRRQFGRRVLGRPRDEPSGGGSPFSGTVPAPGTGGVGDSE